MILDLLLRVLLGLGPYAAGVALGTALRAARAYLVRRRLLAAHRADVRRGPVYRAVPRAQASACVLRW